MLAGPRLGDDALLAHAPREEDLPERVVDFVRAGVEQVFAFEVNFRAAELLREALREVERRGASDVVAEQAVEFGMECGIGLRLFIFRGEIEQRRHQRLRHKHAAEASEVARGVGKRRGIRHGLLHEGSRATDLAAATKRRTLSGLLAPGRSSTPESTSTPQGRATATARATLSGVSPAERMTG